MLCALHAAQLLRQGATLPAAAVAAGAAAMAWGLWKLRTGNLRKMCLRPDGSALLCTRDATEEARVSPCSLRIAGHVLLVLRRKGRPARRLLLGPEMLSPQDVAALGRWVQRPGGEGTRTGVLG